MDAAALKHYAFLRKLGLFVVETGTRRGAAQFLRTAHEFIALLTGPVYKGSDGSIHRL